MQPPPSAYHGRSNITKPAPLPVQNKSPLMANNVVPSAIQQRPQPILQPKTILKHPSQHKSTISQSQIQQQQKPTSSQPSADSGHQSQAHNIQPGTISTSHSPTSHSHSNNLAGCHIVKADKPEVRTTSETKLLKGM